MARFIPGVSAAPLNKLELFDYSKGINSYTHNDIVPKDQLVYATDSRISTLGRMKTRQGLDYYSDAVGETADTAVTSTTGAADQSVTTTAWKAAKYTATGSGRLTKLELNLKNDNAGTAPVMVEIYSDSSGEPGTLLAQSSILQADIAASYGYLPCRFIEAPSVTAASVYWIVVYIQDDGTNDYKWSSTTSATTALSSSDSGVTWASTSYALNFKTYISTSGGTKGLYRAYKSDGTKKTLIANGTALYEINDATGALTSVKTGLNASATDYYFEVAEDIVYYVNGVDAPRKWNFTTDSANPGTTTVSKNIILHKDQVFYLDATNPTRIFFSDKTAFETFTSTNFLYVPSPKSPDIVTGWAVLNDNLYIFTDGTKWALYGSDLSSFTLRRSSGLKGTPSQNTIATTRNYIFFLSDDGVYQFDGSTDRLISAQITDKIRSIVNHDDALLTVWKNKLYLFYTPSGSSANSKCLVYNLDYESWESEDTGTHINKAIVWTGDDHEFIQASSLVGQAFYAESDSNAYNNLGKKVEWEIRTRYEHFDNPAANKRIKRWYPRFATSDGNWTVFCQYDKDFANSPTTQAYLYLRGDGTIWGGGETWGGGSVWGTSAYVTDRLNVPSTATYVQRRYKRHGVNMPTEFQGETIYYQIRRPK